MARERTGVLIVRAWTEEPGAAFRARLIETDDVVAGVWRSRAAGSADDVVASVGEWLAGLGADGDSSERHVTRE